MAYLRLGEIETVGSSTGKFATRSKKERLGEAHSSGIFATRREIEILLEANTVLAYLRLGEKETVGS